jgi:TolB-like protein/DNA-binding SARP family transcriptional activator/tetratricopeptide (TPR) repeat protein
MYRLRLLGGASLEGPDGPVSGRVTQRRRLAVLALLAQGSGHGQSRDKLLGYLWPESGTEQARRLLTVAVYEIRKALGESIVATRGDQLMLDTERLRVDTVEFQAALADGRIEEAVKLHQGPFLDGFYVPDAPELERWIDGERTRLAEAYRRALEALAECRATAGDRIGATEAWRRLAAEDPFHARYALGLMRALDASGERAAAIRHAQLYATLLREELDTDPDEEVLALAERLRHEPGDASRQETPTQPAAGPTSHPAPVETPARIDVPPQQSSAAGAPPHPLEPPPPTPTPSPAGRLPPRAGRRMLLTAALVAALALGWTAVRRPPPTDAATPGEVEKSIAVLPFASLGPDPENDYFSDGIQEDILTLLTRIDRLKVISRTSVLQYRGTEKPVRQIAGELGVNHLLEGSVRRKGDRVRVTVQLIDAEHDRHLWAETFEREIRDVFQIQSEIALHVARVLQVRFAGNGDPTPGRTLDLTAYDFYLQARQYHYFTGGSEENEKGILLLRQALEADSTYPLAYAGLSNRYAAREYYRSGPWLDSAEILARRALELDPNVAYGYDALGTVHRERGHLRRALATYQRALELNPNGANILNRIATVHNGLGRPDLALAPALRAAALDPMVPSRHRQVGYTYMLLDDSERAVHWHGRALQARADFVLSRTDLFHLHLLRGETDRALAELRAVQGLAPGHALVHEMAADHALHSGDPAAAERELAGVVLTLSGLDRARVGLKLADALHRMGRTTEAADKRRASEAVLHELLGAGHESPSVPFQLARAAALGGRHEEMYSWLRRAAASGYVQWRWMQYDPALAPYRGEPRFEAILHQLQARVERMRAAADSRTGTG